MLIIAPLTSFKNNPENWIRPGLPTKHPQEPKHF